MYDWENESMKVAERPKLPDGDHDVRCTQVVFDNQRTGQPFCTRAGDPQIVLELHDSKERSVSVFCTCTDKAGWVLAALMGAAGKDLRALARRGVKPSDFAKDREMCKRELVGMRLRIHVQWEQPDDEYSKPRAKVTPLRTRPVFQDDDAPSVEENESQKIPLADGGEIPF